MPNIRYSVPNTKESVLRPIVLEIVRQLEWLTLIGTNTSITYPDDYDSQYQPGSTIDDSHREQGSLAGSNRVYIEVDEDYDPATILSTAVSMSEHIPIFIDDEIGISMKPVYSTTNVRIAFRFKSNSKTAALRWRDDIRTRSSTMRDMNLHSISYHYLIPDQFIDILKEIHRLRETQGPYGEDWATYMSSNASTRITRLGNLSGSRSSLGVAETQARVIGTFDFEFAPEKGDKDGDEPGWTTTFTYNVRFDKPIEINLKYPPVIHNQVLSTKFRPDAQSFDENKQWRSYSKSASNFKHFEMQDGVDHLRGVRTLLSIPRFDEFLPNNQVYGTYGIFSALCQITDTNNRELMNFNDLIEANFHPEILRFLRESEWSFLCKPYKSVFHCSLFRGFDLAHDSAIVVDSDLNIKSTADLSIRKSHRVFFSVIDDFDLLDPAALERLKKYPLVIELIFKHLGINDIQADKLIKKIYNKYPLEDFLKMKGIMKTVMTGYVVAYSTKEELPLGDF